MPRYFRSVATRNQAVELFGIRYASPFGIAPAGIAGLFRPHADRMLAEEATAAGIPFVMSAASGLRIEDAARISNDHVWFQVYATRDEKIVEDQVRRARESGIKVLVLTVDVPVVPRRERNIRNGFVRPLRMTPRRVYEGLTHPGWLYGFLRSGGVPPFANWQDYAPAGADQDAVADLFGANTPAPGLEWPTLDRLRALWPGKLAVKGLLHPDDARRAVDAGADGIIVSNHGGRQIDNAPSPLDMLPAVCAVVGREATIMLDSGVRRGSDILVSRCLGAKFAFFARPTLHAAAVAGNAGIRKAIEIVRSEVDLTLGQIGCADISNLSADFLTGKVLESAADIEQHGRDCEGR